MARRAVSLLTLMAVWFPLAAGAQSSVSAKVVATDPAGEEISLDRGEPLYVRIAFTSDEPVSIWARPYFRGTEVTNAATNASSPHVGTGDVLGWFSLNEPPPGEVDEIRIFVGTGGSSRAQQVSSYPVHIVGTNLPATNGQPAAWVSELQRQQALIWRQAAAKRAREPLKTGDMVLVSGFMLAMLALLVGGVGAPAWGVWKWRGGWRMAASVPAVLMAFVILRILVDTARDPTSHNLWPFEVLMFGGASVVIMGVLTIARRVTRTDA